MILASGSALCEGSLSSPTLSYSSASNSNSRYSSSSSYSSSSTSTRWENYLEIYNFDFLEINLIFCECRDTTPELPHPYYVYKKVLTATKCSRSPDVSDFNNIYYLVKMPTPLSIQHGFLITLLILQPSVSSREASTGTVEGSRIHWGKKMWYVSLTINNMILL